MSSNIDTNDNLLIIRAFQGDHEAFGILFDKYNSKIYRFIYYKVSNKELAEDLASQCFLKVWEQIALGQKIKSFQAWIYQVARNLIIDYYRTREREELPLIYQEEGESVEPLIDPDKNLDNQALEKVIFNLKNEVREIIVLRFIEELSIKEIAKIVDKSTANVRVIIHRAIKEMQNLVK